MILERVESRDLAHLVVVDDKCYYVDSAYTLDCGYETMAFECDKNGNVLSWRDLYCKHYDSCEEMKKGHEYAIKNLDKLLKGVNNAVSET